MFQIFLKKVRKVYRCDQFIFSHCFFILSLYRSIDSPMEKSAEKEKRRQQSQTLPTTDADMLKAGTSFLDAIEKSLGLG